jgi:hypothetical protein
VDPSDPDTVYFSAQEGAFRRKCMSTDHSVPIRATLPDGHSGELKFNFVAPMILSPHNPHTLYLGGNYLFRSTNRGDDWELISGDVSAAVDDRPVATAASAIAESPGMRGLIYVGTDMGRILVREGDGDDWEDRSSGMPKAYVRSIVASRHSVSRVYAAMSGLNYDDFATYLFVSEDRGRTWQSISGNLSGEPSNVIVEDPVHPDILYAGTFRGVYVSFNRGANWSLLGKNLPVVAIGDLEIQDREMDLIVGTHGRGIYKLNLRPLHDYFVMHRSAPVTTLFPIPTAKLPASTDTRPGTNFRRIPAVTISFASNDNGTVVLDVLDENNMSLAKIEVEAAKGFNQFRWDLVVDEVESDEPYFIQYRKYLSAGRYRVRLSAEGEVASEQTLTVVQE